MEKLISAIPKNQRRGGPRRDGGIRTTHDMISARFHYDAGACEMKPSRNGLNVPVRLLPQLVAALRQAETEARAVGLIEGAAPVEPSHAEGAEYGDGTILGAG